MISWLLWMLFGMGPAQEATLALRPTSTQCKSCHEAEHAQWSRSRHAVAFTNGLFRAEWNERRLAWCASCHAPNALDPRTVRDDDPLAVDGIGCAACHMRDGVLVARTRSERSPHATVVDPEFGGPQDCARCHEFSFPLLDDEGMVASYTHVPMQETVSQFYRAAPSVLENGCIACHMPPGMEHGFPGSHDEDMLASAVAFDVCRTPGGKSLRVEIANVGAGHSIPSGGVHRHMVLRVWRSRFPERLVEHFIGRKFASQPQGGKSLVLDTTIVARERRRYEVDWSLLGGGDQEPVQVELRYVYPLDEDAELPAGTRRSTVMAHLSQLPAELPRCSDDR